MSIKKFAKYFTAVLVVFAATILLSTNVKVSAKTAKIKEIKPKFTEITKTDTDQTRYYIDHATVKKKSAVLVQSETGHNSITVFSGNTATNYDVHDEVSKVCGIDPLAEQYYYEIMSSKGVYYVLGWYYTDQANDKYDLFGFYTKDFKTIKAFKVPKFDLMCDGYIPIMNKVGKNFVFIVNQDVTKQSKKTAYYYVGSKINKLKKKSFPSPVKDEHFKDYIKAKDAIVCCYPSCNGTILDYYYYATAESRDDICAYLNTSVDGKTWGEATTIYNNPGCTFSVADKGKYSIYTEIAHADDRVPFESEYVVVTSDIGLENNAFLQRVDTSSTVYRDVFYDGDEPVGIVYTSYDGDEFNISYYDRAKDSTSSYKVPLSNSLPYVYITDSPVFVRTDWANMTLYAINPKSTTVKSFKIPETVESIFILEGKLILNCFDETAYAVALKDLK